MLGDNELAEGKLFDLSIRSEDTVEINGELYRFNDIMDAALNDVIDYVTPDSGSYTLQLSGNPKTLYRKVLEKSK